VRRPSVDSLSTVRPTTGYLRSLDPGLSPAVWTLHIVRGAVGGFILAATPLGLWLIGAAMCVAGGLRALWIERRIPEEIRRTPRRVPLAEPA
jgi:hypothetical protein